MPLAERVEQKLQDKTLSKLHATEERIIGARRRIQQRKDNLGGEGYPRRLRLDLEPLSDEEYINRVAAIGRRRERDEGAIPALESLEGAVFERVGAVISETEERLREAERLAESGYLPQNLLGARDRFKNIRELKGFPLFQEFVQKESGVQRADRQDRERKEFEGDLRDLTEKQVKVANAIFAINPDRTNFLCPSIKDIINYVYGDELKDLPKEKLRAKLNVGYASLKFFREAILDKIKNARILPSSTAVPELLKGLLDYLNKQPEYKDLSTDWLEKIMHREEDSSFDNLKKMAAISKENSERTVFKGREAISFSPELHSLALIIRRLDENRGAPLNELDKIFVDHIVEEGTKEGEANPDITSFLLKRIERLQNEDRSKIWREIKETYKDPKDVEAAETLFAIATRPEMLQLVRVQLESLLNT